MNERDLLRRVEGSVCRPGASPALRLKYRLLFRLHPFRHRLLQVPVFPVVQSVPVVPSVPDPP